MAVNPRSLVGRLNATCRTALEAAAGLCLSRGHHDVEIEHFLLKLVEVDNGDIRRILRQFDLPPEGLERALGKVLDGLKRSEEHTSELQSLMRISYAVFCLKKKKNIKTTKKR